MIDTAPNTNKEAQKKDLEVTCHCNDANLKLKELNFKELDNSGVVCTTQIINIRQ